MTRRPEDGEPWRVGPRSTDSEDDAMSARPGLALRAVLPNAITAARIAVAVSGPAAACCGAGATDAANGSAGAPAPSSELAACTVTLGAGRGSAASTHPTTSLVPYV